MKTIKVPKSNRGMRSNSIFKKASDNAPEPEYDPRTKDKVDRYKGHIDLASHR